MTTTILTVSKKDGEHSWKSILANYYTKVPKTLGEALWKIGMTVFIGTATLVGFSLYRNPGIIMGQPREQQSITQVLAAHPGIRSEVFDMMKEFYLTVNPEGLMLVSWDRIDELVGLWVKPADDFPGKAGPHDLTPDMRVLGGPFLFGECGSTESIAKPGMTMVACPIINDFDVWGYVAAVVETESAESVQRLVNFLAHRLTVLIY